MIRYALKCEDGHEFESWFESAAAFDRLVEKGHVTCSVCGALGVEKAIMSPRVHAPKSSVGSSKGSSGKRPLSGPASPAEQALSELRRVIEKHAENVGNRFAKEARAIHAGDAPERPIYGSAKTDDARALIEDGIPVAPLPWGSERTN